MDAFPAVTVVVRVDSLMARTLELEGGLGFYCPLLRDTGLSDHSVAGNDFSGGIREVSYRELAPVLYHPRAGVMAVVRDGRVLSYAVFGPPAVFRRAYELPFALDERALLIAALYPGPEARAENLDIDLLLAVLEFAREQGFELVQALCRDDPESGTEARASVISAAGFEVVEPLPGRLPASARGLCLGVLVLNAQ